MMVSRGEMPTLDRIMLRLMVLRLFLPLLILGIMAIVGIGYLVEQTLETRQRQNAQSIVRMVDRYMEQSGRILDAVGRVAENSSPENLKTVMQSNWEAHGVFDTIYYLNKDNKINMLVPLDPRYLGLDMSNLPYIPDSRKVGDFYISSPFISLRTGNPTVYLIRSISNGRHVVGELNLGSLQDDIEQGGSGFEKGSIFIMDQSGTLIAHPSSELVKQQTNLGYLEIFRRGLNGEATIIYRYGGTMVLGSALPIKMAKWVVVAQNPLSAVIGPYIWILGFVFFASFIVLLMLVWNLRKRLRQDFVAPLVQLSQGTKGLSVGDYSQVNALASIPTTFSELNGLTADFLHMSDALETRQRELQESEERYRSLFEGVPIGLFRSDPAGRILDANSAYIYMLGFPDVTTFIMFDVNNVYVTPEDRIRWQSIAKEMGVLQNFETQMRRYDKALIWVRINCRVTWGKDGKIQYYEGSFEDITARKLAEEEIKDLNRGLEMRVAERTSQLEVANKELETFAYSVSHDLRAPLRSIDGFSQAILDEYSNSLDTRGQDYLSRVRASAQRMGQIIDDLLRLSRVTRAEMQHEQVNLSNIVLEKLTSLKDRDQERQSEFIIQPDVIAVGDASLLRIALENLLDNAWKFTSRAPVAKIEFGTMLQDGECVYFVRDNGVGFDMAYSGKLFEPFQRLHSDSDFPGTGIGGAIVKRVITRHGGQVWAEGAVGRGAAFYFTL